MDSNHRFKTSHSNEWLTLRTNPSMIISGTGLSNVCRTSADHSAEWSWHLSWCCYVSNIKNRIPHTFISLCGKHWCSKAVCTCMAEWRQHYSSPFHSTVKLEQTLRWFWNCSMLATSEMRLLAQTNFQRNSMPMCKHKGAPNWKGFTCVY